MIALLYKDFINLKKALLFILGFCVFFSCVAVYENKPQVIPAVFLFIPVILMSMIFGYDMRSNTEKYIIPAPVSKTKIVLSRYCLLWITAAVSVVVSLIIYSFAKIEMFVYCEPSQSEALHEKLRSIEEEIFSGLGIPFRVIETCTGDLGAPAYRKWDLEAWMPGRNGGEWGEVTSTSNCTDYQARRLNVKYKDENGKNAYVHMLNGTALAMSRALVALLENYQQKDGSVKIPEVLVPFCGFDVITRPNRS